MPAMQNILREVSRGVAVTDDAPAPPPLAASLAQLCFHCTDGLCRFHKGDPVPCPRLCSNWISWRRKELEAKLGRRVPKPMDWFQLAPRARHDSDDEAQAVVDNYPSEEPRALPPPGTLEAFG